MPPGGRGGQGQDNIFIALNNQLLQINISYITSPQRQAPFTQGESIRIYKR